MPSLTEPERVSLTYPRWPQSPGTQMQNQTHVMDGLKSPPLTRKKHHAVTVREIPKANEISATEKSQLPSSGSLFLAADLQRTAYHKGSVSSEPLHAGLGSAGGREDSETPPRHLGKNRPANPVLTIRSVQGLSGGTVLPRGSRAGDRRRRDIRNAAQRVRGQRAFRPILAPRLLLRGMSDLLGCTECKEHEQSRTDILQNK